MYGAGIGELHVYRTLQGRSLIWRRMGDQGDFWVMAEVSIQGDPTRQITIEFEAVVGSTKDSDIAIDDMSIRSGPCDTAGNLGICYHAINVIFLTFFFLQCM